MNPLLDMYPEAIEIPDNNLSTEEWNQCLRKKVKKKNPYEDDAPEP